ncbi:hypothetical protein ARMSODRAFT_974105 [Armillaria solidipes]|uniref:Uncharacterized protein n=1 Tax=Armillaria solidipes TaxID=1076256 RepID=A0A2H3BMH6_9AGAR|nr:hypothetical protein ARMSODRAFT_974105 [Armillaria solidipes]
MYRWIGVDWRLGCNSMTCILGYPAALILLRTMFLGPRRAYIEQQKHSEGAFRSLDHPGPYIRTAIEWLCSTFFCPFPPPPVQFLTSPSSTSSIFFDLRCFWHIRRPQEPWIVTISSSTHA